ncbi:protein-tyrosine-phosphatase [Coemansia biformis]|uniref:Protein-tyrosine-phosphatase n=1 Tax=Coemansia biformis TaxID=1286918 RepID=A0A9W7YEY2_9FUNG|nr:protein-tyrosine-phosphatase [Coemansia biformis]
MSDIIDPLIPPHRFERVQNQVYRGGYPKHRNFRFLRRLGLKTIVSLIPGDQDSALAEFCAREGIERVCMQVESPNENVTLKDQVVSRCLGLMTDPHKLPLYVHCLDGSNVTGVVVMCLRKLQLWRVASLQNEYLRFEQDGEIIPEESEFVEMYAGAGLVLPNPYADYLWPGRPPADGLPFQGGTHPVVPLARLRPRAAAAEPPVAPKRAATDPSTHDSASRAAPGSSPAQAPCRAQPPEAAPGMPSDQGVSASGQPTSRVQASQMRDAGAHDDGRPAGSDRQREETDVGWEAPVLRTTASATALPAAAEPSDAAAPPEPLGASAQGSGRQPAAGSRAPGPAGGADSPGRQDRTEVAINDIEEVALSVVIQALAIEGLGM